MLRKRKSPSIHYYFATKGDLGAALANRYTALQYLDRRWNGVIPSVSD